MVAIHGQGRLTAMVLKMYQFFGRQVWISRLVMYLIASGGE
ncbi:MULTISPECIES: hypothetical protein [Nitrosomonas]|nr:MULTISPECIES: hypothetical protein [Nitrosomonas]UVS60153.1 hypothetical protein NX761_11540 [Nitrosomonas sp. PLL12]